MTPAPPACCASRCLALAALWLSSATLAPRHGLGLVTASRPLTDAPDPCGDASSTLALRPPPRVSGPAVLAPPQLPHRLPRGARYPAHETTEGNAAAVPLSVSSCTAAHPASLSFRMGMGVFLQLTVAQLFFRPQPAESPPSYPPHWSLAHRRPQPPLHGRAPAAAANDAVAAPARRPPASALRGDAGLPYAGRGVARPGWAHLPPSAALTPLPRHRCPRRRSMPRSRWSSCSLSAASSVEWPQLAS